MKKNRFVAIVLMLTMLFTLGACSNTEPDPGTEPSTTPTTTAPEALTAAQIAEKMQEALAETPCSKLELAMDLAITFDAGDSGKMDMTTKSTTQTVISQDPFSSYSSASAEVSIVGETTTAATDTYIVLENGELVSYVNSNGIWMKAPLGQTPEDFLTDAASVSVDPGNVTLDEAVTEWSGRSIICLRTQLSGDLVEKALGDLLRGTDETSGILSESAGILDSVDYSNLTCDAVIYLDPETYLPIAEEMTFNGMNDVMAPIYEGLGLALDVTRCVSTAAFLSYDPQPEVVLPEGAAEKAEAWTRLLSGEPDNGDGTFTIREGIVLIDLVHPEGFEVAEKDYDHVTFRREDYRQITFTMYYQSGTDTTGAAFIADNDWSEERWTIGGGQVKREQMTVSTDSLTFTCDLLATTWETGREDATFYAWTPLATDDAGTYYLHVEITDGYNDGMGFSKSADITSDEFMAYLNAATLSKLTAK